MRIVSESAARRAVSLREALEVTEKVFASLELGHAQAFPVVSGRGSSIGTRFSAKSGLIEDQRLPGLKIGSYWPANRARSLLSHASTTLLLDDETGYPHALVASSYLTALRTAALDAVAVKFLARPEASQVTIVGAGHQAWFDLLAICEVRPVSSVNVWSRCAASAKSFALRVRNELGLPAFSMPLQAAVETAHIIVTATAAEQALVHREWVSPGTHISAMGADAPGKQELDIELVAHSRLFADVIEQAISIGEFQKAHAAGRISRSAITPLGAVIAGRVPGRGAVEEITIFDSSGVALQDLAVAALALANAERRGDIHFADLS